MWILILISLLLGAQFSFTALVPLQPGDVPAPWWVGGRLLWPFAIETRTLIPAGDLLNMITSITAILSGLLFLMAAAALLRRLIPAKWFRGLIIAGAVLAIPLQIIWFTGWAILPILVNLLLLWAVFAKNITVESLRGLGN
jgi:hypothetical protein